jgi:hypothetical protein
MKVVLNGIRALSTAAVISIAQAQVAMTSEVVACISETGAKYYSVDQFVRGWSGYVRDDAYVLAVCRENRMVTIRATDDSPDLSHAQLVVVNMAASIERESLDYVVERFVWQKFEAQITKVDRDGCICAGNN